MRLFAFFFLLSSLAYAQLPPDRNPLGLRAFRSGGYAPHTRSLVMHSSLGTVEPHNFCEAYSETMFQGLRLRMQPPPGTNEWRNPHLETIIAATIRRNDSAWNRFWGLHELQQWTWGNTNRWGRNVAMSSVYVPRGYVLELFNNMNYEPSGGGLIVAGARLQDLEGYASQINSVRCVKTNEDESFVFPM